MGNNYELEIRTQLNFTGTSAVLLKVLHQIILFDGVCKLCSGSVNFIIKYDPEQHFQFASLQSEIGQKYLSKFDQEESSINSLVLIDADNIFFKSTAALRIAKKLNYVWPLFYLFIIIPKPIRDFAYDLVAKNRYKIFGKKESCLMSDRLSKNPFI